MAFKSRPSSGDDRREILRGVYEDNLRTTSGVRGSLAASRGVSGPASRRGRRRAGSLAAVAALLLAGSLYQWRGSDAVATVAVEGEPGWRREARSGAFDPADPELREAYLREAAAGAIPPEAGIADLYGLQLRTIIIDPGHGGVDPGAIGQQGVMEKDVTLDVARRLRRRLERYPGYRIILTRDDDEKLTLRERVTFANEQKADLFLSLHVNWLPDTSLVPVETYYYGPGSDVRAREAAGRENRNSGYSVAEFNELTRRLGTALKIEESKDVAASIQRSLYENLRSLNDGVIDWGAKSGDFMVLLGVEAPSVLVEIASLNNPAEEARLNTPEHRELLAGFLEQGILDYLGTDDHPNGSSEDASEAKD